MLGSAKALKGHTIQTRDGEIGKVHDLYFDDATWKIRYLVASIGTWFRRCQVLIPPEALEESDRTERILSVGLTRGQVENSPDIDADKPVSRQKKFDQDYLIGSSVHWAFCTPVLLSPPLVEVERESEGEQPTGDPHLRSMRTILGYRIQAIDGGHGHVEDFIIDDKVWILRYMVVDTRNWLPSKETLVAVPWIRKIEWESRVVFVGLPRERIEYSPIFDTSKPIDQKHEQKIYELYGRDRY